MCVSTEILSIRNLYFLILSENTRYKGGALSSLRFEMSAMILSGSLAKDRDLSFGVHCSKIFLSTVWLEKKRLNTYFLNYKRIPTYRAEVKSLKHTACWYHVLWSGQWHHCTAVLSSQLLPQCLLCSWYNHVCHY